MAWLVAVSPDMVVGLKTRGRVVFLEIQGPWLCCPHWDERKVAGNWGRMAGL